MPKPPKPTLRTKRKKAKVPRREQERVVAMPTRVILRTSDVDVHEVGLGSEAQRIAIGMSYVVRNRRRWADREEARAKQSADTRATLENVLGVDADALRRIAAAGFVEVEVPFVEEKSAWEARVMPWEYMLSGGTRPYRYSHPLTVTRRLRRSGMATTVPRVPRRLLFVETAPCDLREGYTFDYERKLVQEGVGPDVDVHLLQDPTRSQLEAAIKDFEPDIIHVTGFDNHQGMALLGLANDPARKDGILLRRDDNSPDPVPEQEAARILASAQQKPLLVSLNLFNSGARTAALTVAEGAAAAIGFQDEFEDPIAESFFATFYRAWKRSKWRTHSAFRASLIEMLSAPNGLQGTGVVLWTSFSAFDARPSLAPDTHTPVKTKKQTKMAGASGTSATIPSSEEVEVRVDPYTELNYSMLHNNRELFDVFLVRNFTPEKPHDVHVRVTLYVGTESYPCEYSFRMTEPIRDLAKDIHVPLISVLGRSVRESMRTSLFVHLECDGRVRHCQTHSVTLLPIDQWRDDDDNRHWLPSFVLPRDPIVPQIVDAAQRYLMTVRDDPNAGFDGYQSFGDGTTDDPAAPIDFQVQAIWSALLYEFPLSYINPPPTFTDFSQRLRSPSEIVRGKRGTCIDLALLLSSCLEFIGLHPVIILLNGHCFPGYWRSEEAHADFERVSTPDAIKQGEADALREVVGGQQYAWLFDKGCFREVRECVERNDLVLIETVNLTQHSGFWAAVEEGTRNLRNQAEFESMMDVQLARESDVTPLPMIDGIHERALR